MKLLRFQYGLSALIIISFLLCMFFAVSLISEQNSVSSVVDSLPKPNVVDFHVDGNSVKSQGNAYDSRTDGTRISMHHASSLNNFEINDTYRMNPTSLIRSRRDHLVRRKTTGMSFIRSSKVDNLTGAKMTGVEEQSNDLPAPNYGVHVFYYPWYGSPAVDGRYLHWNHRLLPHWKPEVAARYPSGRHMPPDDIGASFYPRLGPYSSRDPAVIEDHMRQIRSSGAGVLSVSWYPPGLADDEGDSVDAIIPQLLEAAQKYDLKICLHIEPYADRNDVTLRKNLQYIVSQYGNHSAFYRWPASNLPLYYIYDSYKVPDAAWTSLLSAAGSGTIRGTSLDGVFIGLAVERTHVEQLMSCGFDGFYTYFATDGFTYGSSTRNWAALARFAVERRALFVPSVGPGYDDTSIRPWNSLNTRDRQRGQYYERSFAEAVKVRPPIVSITSFNEWGEGTQIEEAIPKTTNNHTYVDYQPEGADFYLRLTRKWVFRYSQQNSTEL